MILRALYFYYQMLWHCACSRVLERVTPEKIIGELIDYKYFSTLRDCKPANSTQNRFIFPADL